MIHLTPSIDEFTVFRISSCQQFCSPKTNLNPHLTIHPSIADTYLIDFSDPPVDPVKRPPVGDVIHQQNPLRTDRLSGFTSCRVCFFPPRRVYLKGSAPHLSPAGVRTKDGAEPPLSRGVPEDGERDEQSALFGSAHWSQRCFQHQGQNAGLKTGPTSPEKKGVLRGCSHQTFLPVAQLRAVRPSANSGGRLLKTSPKVRRQNVQSQSYCLQYHYCVFITHTWINCSAAASFFSSHMVLWPTYKMQDYNLKEQVAPKMKTQPSPTCWLKVGWGNKNTEKLQKMFLKRHSVAAPGTSFKMQENS